jgi:hypothetical protein
MDAEYKHEGLIYQEPLPRIGLINFSDTTSQSLIAKSHNVVSCPLRREGNENKITAPKSPHDMDILLIRDQGNLETSLVATAAGRHELKALITFSEFVLLGSGVTMRFDAFCQAVIDKGGLCVFFVSRPHGNLLSKSGRGLIPNDQKVAITGSTTFKVNPHVKYEALTSFVDRSRRIPKFYLGIDGQHAESLLEDSARNRLVAVKTQEGVQKPGAILCLPDYGDDPNILHSLLSEVLPEISSFLFPFRFDTSWLDDPLFANPAIAGLETQKSTIRSHADQQVTQLDSQIQTIKQGEKYMTDILLTGDDELKKAVKQALEEIFRIVGMASAKVIDVDDDPTLRDGSRQFREDLRIELGTHVILIDVAGNDNPMKESRINQLDKHKRQYLTSNTGVANKTHSLLIANYNKRGGGNPSTRGQMFGTGTDQAAARLTDAGHSAISTLDVFRLIRGLQGGDISLREEEVRSFLMGDGILDFDVFSKSVQKKEPTKAC